MKITVHAFKQLSSSVKWVDNGEYYLIVHTQYTEAYEVMKKKN